MAARDLARLDSGRPPGVPDSIAAAVANLVLAAREASEMAESDWWADNEIMPPVRQALIRLDAVCPLVPPLAPEDVAAWAATEDWDL